MGCMGWRGDLEDLGNCVWHAVCRGVCGTDMDLLFFLSFHLWFIAGSTRMILVSILKYRV